MGNCQSTCRNLTRKDNGAAPKYCSYCSMKSIGYCWFHGIARLHGLRPVPGEVPGTVLTRFMSAGCIWHCIWHYMVPTRYRHVAASPRGERMGGLNQSQSATLRGAMGSLARDVVALEIAASVPRLFHCRFCSLVDGHLQQLED